MFNFAEPCWQPGGYWKVWTARQPCSRHSRQYSGTDQWIIYTVDQQTIIITATVNTAIKLYYPFHRCIKLSVIVNFFELHCLLLISYTHFAPLPLHPPPPPPLRPRTMYRTQTPPTHCQKLYSTGNNYYKNNTHKKARISKFLQV